MQRQMQEMQRRHDVEITTLRAKRCAEPREQFAQQSVSLARNPSRENDQAGEPSRSGQEANIVAARTTHHVHTVQAEVLLPFIVVVMEAPMLQRKMPPTFKKYNRSTDPNEHLCSFVSTREFYSSSDLVWCRAFSLSLKGETLAWFNNLPPNMVDFFITIHTLFSRQYASSRAQSLTHMELINTK